MPDTAPPLLMLVRMEYPSLASYILSLYLLELLLSLLPATFVTAIVDIAVVVSAIATLPSLLSVAVTAYYLWML